VIKKRCLTET